MSEINCGSCADLIEFAPDFVEHGVTDDIAASLADNTGLNPNLNVLHTDCQDLNSANDCLIGVSSKEIESYDACDWKVFMKRHLGNLYELLKAMIAAICGLWSKLEALITEVGKIKTDIKIASYLGILELYTTTTSSGSSSDSTQIPAFNRSRRSGNMPTAVLTANSNYKGITVRNTLSVPLLINTTFNSSIYTDQPFCCCYIVVTRDGNQIGQTPFITPSTYDQQVMAKPFILNPGQSASLSYYFKIGQANNWFVSQFGGTGNCQCVLAANSSTEAVQGSYFTVQATTIAEEQ